MKDTKKNIFFTGNLMLILLITLCINALIYLIRRIYFLYVILFQVDKMIIVNLLKISF